jgi:high-affinity K+ transport system ATPase subunit B
MKQKSPNELKDSIRFYRTITVLLICVVMFIGFNNVSTTNKCKKFEEELKVQMAKNKVLAEELKETQKDIVMGTCLLKSDL